MRNLFLGCALLPMFLMVAWAAAPTNFSGTWKLDAAKSEGLPPQMQGDLSWVITQDDKTLKKTVQGPMAGVENYNLDGSEVSDDVAMGQGTAKAKRMAKVMDAMLELKSALTIERNGNSFTTTITQHLELTADGKTLNVHQIRETPRGKMESKLVFTRQ